ncbi:MAG: hypothetical protein MUC96_22885 [Myxococcaceae bacterium]|jgi:hypothetical protein|nr:hypothetical protein [Myxococcaceae bacterium]
MLAALASVVLAVDGGTPPVRQELARLARQVAPQAETPWVRQWLATFETLEPVTPQTWFCSKPERRCVKKAPPDAGFTARVVDDEFIYARIADPLGYLRAYELAAANGFVPAKKKVVDFGYGNLGALLPLARLGANVHGVEVDPLLVAGTAAFQRRVTLHDGFFPKDGKLVQAMGKGVALWLSKNTLKRGYVHPAEPPGAKGSIDLGADDVATLKVIHSQLEPGGVFLIYNLAAVRPGPYVPMADGRCPFSREAFVEAGFEVIAFDADDTPKAKAMARALEWSADWPDVGQTLVATWTLARRPKHQGP